MLRTAPWVFWAALLVSQGDQRAPVPDPADQERSGELIREVFKEEYARKSPADQKTLARKLLRQGIETKEDAASRYVLFREAREIAEKGGDLETAMAAIAETAKYFEIDGTALKANALAGMAAGAKSPEAAALTDACLQVIDEAVREEKFEVARSLVAKAESAAKAAKDLKKVVQVQKKGKEIEELSKESQKAKEAAKKLEANPADPEASLALGRHLLMKGNVEKALGLLAKGSDPLLKAAAEKELAAPASPADQAAAGDAWWEAAEKETNAAVRAAIHERVRICYRAAVRELTGLVKARTEKRLSQIEASAIRSAGNWIDLLRLIDPSRDSRAGSWTLTDGKLMATRSGVLEIPYEPPSEYDFLIKFSRDKARSAYATVGQILKKDGRGFAWVMGHNWRYFGFEMVNGVTASIPANPTRIEHELVEDQTHTSTIEIRNGGAKAYLDGKLMAEMKRYDNLKLWPATEAQFTNKMAIGIYSPDATTIYFEIRVREVSGFGKPLR